MTVIGPLMGPRMGALGIRARLAHPGARRWYAGASIGLLYQAFLIVAIWTTPGNRVADQVVATVALALFYVLYLFVPPLIWPEREAVRIGVTVGMLLLSC